MRCNPCPDLRTPTNIAPQTVSRLNANIEWHDNNVFALKPTPLLACNKDSKPQRRIHVVCAADRSQSTITAYGWCRLHYWAFENTQPTDCYMNNHTQTAAQLQRLICCNKRQLGRLQPRGWKQLESLMWLRGTWFSKSGAGANSWI